MVDGFQAEAAQNPKTEELEVEPLPSDTKPIDFSRWRDYSEPLVNSSIGALPYKTLAGDFYRNINPAQIFVMVYQTIIDRASRPSRTRISETQFRYINQRLTINYHRRPEAGIEEMDYETVVRGLAWLLTALLRNQKFAEITLSGATEVSITVDAGGQDIVWKVDTDIGKAKAFSRGGPS
ncbi:MAG: hypothetical protein Q9167_005937 [Letrouitia subvulpina]